MRRHTTDQHLGHGAGNSGLRKLSKRLLLLSVGIIFIEILGAVIFGESLRNVEVVPGVFVLGGLALVLQLLLGIIYIFTSGLRLQGFFLAISAPFFGVISIITSFFIFGGPGWGRPLRIKGRQIHPELRKGSDWTQGAQPDASQLDQDTRKALAALWLHDAQKEHASVPAFSRISWMLAAVGAPADLMAWAHRSALEEIDHTRLCFALAAGYGGQSYTVEPMPDLLLGGLDSHANPIITLAKESLMDGCQLEDFNADVAGACAQECLEPVTRAVLEQIAREERLHADFSWALLAWLLQHSPAKVRSAIDKALLELEDFKRPTAVRWDKQALVAKADPGLLLQHGRLPDTRWAELWQIRLATTRQRLAALLVEQKAA